MNRNHLPTVNNDQQLATAPVKLAYSIVASAKLVSSSRSQLYLEIQKGRLPATKIGGRTVILHEDLVAWLRRLPRKPARADQR